MNGNIQHAGWFDDSIDEISVKCSKLLAEQLRQPIKQLTMVVAITAVLGLGYVVFWK